MPEYLMRGLQDHKDLLADGLSQLTASAASVVDGSSPPEFNASFEAKYDREFQAQFKKKSAAVEMLSLSQSRFGLPGITEKDRDKGEDSLAPALSPAVLTTQLHRYVYVCVIVQISSLRTLFSLSLD